MIKPLRISTFPRAVLHIDGDCFFASCEIAKNPSLRGKPVVTGMERGIASSLSYEAKAMGVKRTMTIAEVRKVCPQVIFLPSDYESYSLYSMKMYNIVRRFTSDVEEYSIDECFADLTGLRRPLNMSYEKMAEKIKLTLDTELGITFSVGLAPTKVLAKAASKWKKPSGLTIIRAREIHLYLSKLAVGDVWGIGPQTTALLNKLGIYTAYEFVEKDIDWLEKNLSKPYCEIWHELRGKNIYDLETKAKRSYKSISKTKTFTPASNNRELVFSQLSKNVENAFIKARRYKLVTQKMFFFLKGQDFKFYGFELKMNRATNVPIYIMEELRKIFDKVFDEKKNYRATGVALLELKENNNVQLDLFEQSIKIDKASKLFVSFDKLADRYGKHTLFLGSSWQAINHKQHAGDRANPSERKKNLLYGEDERKRLNLAMLGEVN